MPDKKPLIISDAGMLSTPRTRRDILKLMGLGGTMVLLPSMLVACGDDKTTNPIVTPTLPNTGNPLTIDFSKGDTAVLQFAYALEQLEADFYTRVVNAFGTSTFTAAEKTILTDIKYHEVLHREFFKAALGTTNGFTITTAWGSQSFTDRAAVLATASALEETGVKAYNGAAQYLTDINNLLYAGKIVSVEARHASAIADLIAPNGNTFAPKTFDDVFRPATIAATAQLYIVDKLTLANPPATFVQGPNNNG